MATYIEIIPILTTIFSIYFLTEIIPHYQKRKTPYLFWWTFGVLTFGLGTLTESLNIIIGWTELNFRIWYIVGALLGGFPLAQGSVYLLMNKKFAKWTTVFFMILICFGSVFVISSPLTSDPNFNGKLTGSIFTWSWVRYFSPLINIYAFIFLVGGAYISARRYKKMGNKEVRYIGNIYIAIGGLLPGIGGSFTRLGYVNVLFITEFIGLVMIYIGYKMIKKDKYKHRLFV